MVEMTQGTPRSSDGLQMEWVEATFGPLFPGLPGGLSLTFTLDGDTVAETEVGGEMEGWAPVEILAGPADGLADRAARLDPLSPVAYRLLALRAVEDATGTPPDEETALARVGALERERAASHLGWLASFAHLLGYAWLEGRAARLQLALLGAEDAGAVARLRGEAKGLGRRVERTPLLRRKLAGLGELGEESHVRGRLARAAGRSADVRADDEAYRSLGFGPVVVDGDDALSRLRARLREIEQSIDLVERAGKISLPDGAPREREPAAGTGTATVETPRGAATLGATFEGGEVVEAELDSPSTRRLSLVEGVTEGQEFANALVAVASLDLSPWEVAR
ncbi:NADH-quinone oxidoreductase subunit D (plasmid) [Rubrobacter marinus]|uniref:NADH-quinone oxidoreductase subunit D n=2 Tax=Rubrobacter marinus TaxID=2653852 RepID=A0A6G8Q3X6_9ACTN|nr:NADH-quinone oxidoreductase subunit D [Rubrobacter marinus]